MTRTEVLSWLASRTPAPPAPLAERMARAVSDFPETVLARNVTLADALAAIGAFLLAQVTEDDPGRPGLALDLLAADAFVTYAVEAAALLNGGTQSLADRIMAQAEQQ